MTGFEHYNVANFERVADLFSDDFSVTTPFECNSRVWMFHHGRRFDPYTDRCDYGDPVLREMFAEDVKALLESDTVVVLDGWEKSTGAKREVLLAQTFGIPVVDERNVPVKSLVTVGLVPL